MTMEKNSILDHFLDHVETRGDDCAAMVKRDGRYREVSWKNMAEDAKAVASALLALGIQAGDRVGIISHTRIEWVTTDLGILWAAGVTVPVYPSNLPDECQYVLSHSDSRLVFCENAEQVAKLLEKKAELPEIVKVVQLEGL